jgi:hypothetical protein
MIVQQMMAENRAVSMGAPCRFLKKWSRQIGARWRPKAAVQLPDANSVVLQVVYHSV